METARAIKFRGFLPSKFWTEYVEFGVYIINRIPYSVLGNKSPFEILYYPNLQYLRVIDMSVMQPIYPSMISLVSELSSQFFLVIVLNTKDTNYLI